MVCIAKNNSGPVLRGKQHYSIIKSTLLGCRFGLALCLWGQFGGYVASECYQVRQSCKTQEEVQILRHETQYMSYEISLGSRLWSTSFDNFSFFFFLSANTCRGRNRAGFGSIDSVALYFTGVSETYGWSQSFSLPTHTRGAINIIVSSSWPSSSSLPSSGYQLSPVACAIYLLLLRARAHRHTDTHARTHIWKQSKCLHVPGGRGLPLPLSRSLSVSLQSWAAGAAEAERRQSSNSRSVRHRQTDRLTERQAPRPTQTASPDRNGLDQDRAARLLMRQDSLASVFWGGDWFRYVE